MVIWRQTSLFAYNDDLSLENLMPYINYFGEPTPYTLVRKGIEKFSRPGDLILDPGCGNGTTGAVALELNRNVVLSDINQLAVRTLQSFFLPYTDQQVISVWDEVVHNLLNIQTFNDKRWDDYMHASLPELPAFRLVQKKVGSLANLFHVADLAVFKGLYLGIEKIQCLPVQQILRAALDTSIMEISQLIVNHQRRSFNLSRCFESKDPVDLIFERLELMLTFRGLLQEYLVQYLQKSPIVQVASAYQLDYLDHDSVDYVLFHLPGLNGYKIKELNYLGYRLRCQNINTLEEIEIELDYRGRYRLIRELTRLLKEMDRVLKENGYLTLIFSGHYILLSLIIRVAQNEGWQLVQGEVEMVKGGLTEEYPVMSVTLQKKRLHTVLGALNKMKVETLYDTEEAILRKIDQYLTEQNMATLEDIQHYLIENYLHDCLIEKPLEVLLEENYLWSGKYWLKPSDEQKGELLKKRGEAMQKAFPEFIREMAYTYLREEETVLSYKQLLERFMQIRPRGVFHTPYYRLLVEQCEKQKIKLNQLIQNYFAEIKKDSFETLTQVLRKIIRSDTVFVEILPGELIGLAEWSHDQFFKIYFELYEKSKRNPELIHYQNLGKKVLELLSDVTYLDECKRERIREYIKRSESL